jgi:non-heme chloroperoxidase
MNKSPRETFVTSDGVQLSYIRQGSGRPIVLIHGWSQCAEEFKHQIEPLSARYDVIAVDQRSHGESQKVPYGLRISRLSKDLYELVTELDLNGVALLGHSMGACVIRCYIDLFGPERLSKIILVDQSPFLMTDPYWTQQEVEHSGAIDTADQPACPDHKRSSKLYTVEIARVDSSSNQRFTVRSIRRVRRWPALYVHREP